MGLWNFIQRMAKMEKPEQMWFVVNGVPIRYGLREHGLLCGFDCHRYPKNYKTLGGGRLVSKYFGKDAQPWVEHVETKLCSMSPSEDRLKMAVLWFLAIVIKGKTKVAGPIDSFILRIVDDLPKCETFPWGRFTFDDCKTQILKLHSRMKGIVSPSTTLPGFILPIELLPFEAIPNLKMEFRENVPCEDKCPRMCKGRFKDFGKKGFELGDIYKTLGNSTEITSILVAKGEERNLMAEIMGEEDDLKYDMVVDGWTTILANGETILWTDLLERDLAHRNNPTIATADGPPATDDQVPPHGLQESITEMAKAMMEGFKTLNGKVGELNDKVGGLASRIENLEDSNVYDKAAGKKVMEMSDDGDDEEEEDKVEEKHTEEEVEEKEEDKVEEEAREKEEEEKEEEEDDKKKEEEDKEEDEDDKEKEEEEKEDDEARAAAEEAGATVVPETMDHDDSTPHGPTGYTDWSAFSGSSANAFATAGATVDRLREYGKEVNFSFVYV